MYFQKTGSKSEKPVKNFQKTYGHPVYKPFGFEINIFEGTK